MSRLIPDAADLRRPYAFSESEREYLLRNPDLMPLLRRVDEADIAPFCAALKALHDSGSITRDFAARIMITFRHRRRLRALAAYRKNYPKRTILSLGNGAEEEL